MKLLFVADGRSPIAMNWIGYFAAGGHEVHLASTFSCTTDLPFASVHHVPVALSGFRGQAAGGSGSVSNRDMLGGIAPVRFRTAIRRWLAPLTISNASLKLKQLITRVQPDLVHAMRIPFEGMLAAMAVEDLPAVPLVVSVWGNDFTLHAPSTPKMGSLTRRTLQRANALHTDCQRDLRLARQWGYAGDKRAFVLPGGGGIQLDVFHLAQGNPASALTETGLRVINPRGIRAYIRNDTFFKAIPLIWRQSPEVGFICPAMSADRQAEQWVSSLGLSKGVELLPRQTRLQMAELFRRAHIAVSPSEHDGTPNTLLEAMACGCFPIAGDIESVREWINPGENGLLFDPGSPHELAEAVLKALREPELRSIAAAHNSRLIAERAEYRSVMQEAERHYREITLTGMAAG